MSKATAPGRERDPGVKMTIRVYSVNRGGQVTQDRGTLSIMPGEGPLPTTAEYPPCECVGCRGRRAAQ